MDSRFIGRVLITCNQVIFDFIYSLVVNVNKYEIKMGGSLSLCIYTPYFLKWWKVTSITTKNFFPMQVIVHVHWFFNMWEVCQVYQFFKLGWGVACFDVKSAFGLFWQEILISILYYFLISILKLNCIIYAEAKEVKLFLFFYTNKLISVDKIQY